MRPLISQYGPDLLVSCQNASDLAEDLVRGWLAAYMFRNEGKGKSKAKSIARWLSTHSHFKSHGRPISREELQAQGLNVTALEADQTAQDLILSVFHATSHTFSQTGAVKIIENHLGKAFVNMVQMIVQQAPANVIAQPAKPDQGPPTEPKPGKTEKTGKTKKPATKHTTTTSRQKRATKKKTTKPKMKETGKANPIKSKAATAPRATKKRSPAKAKKTAE